MAGVNFTNDYGTGIVTADGYADADGTVILVTEDGVSTFTPDVVAPVLYETLPSYTVAQLAALSPQYPENSVVICSNGNAGAKCLAVRVGTSWLRVVFGAAVAAT